MDIQVIFMQMIQLFLIMALGYFLLKVHIFDIELNKKLTTFILAVTTPAMILSSVLSTTEYQSFTNILFVFIIGIVITYIVLPIIGFILVKVMNIPQSQQGLYIFMTVFSNIGFMGFPVIKSIFGNDAIFYTAIFNMTFNLCVYTIGPVIMNYGTKKEIQINIKNLLSPGVVASIVAMALYLTKITVPNVVASTVTMIGDITTPIAMLIIGSTLATIPLKDVFNDKRVYCYTFIKQVIIPVAIYPVLSSFIHDTLILGVTFIMFSMPVGNSAVLFATEYDGNVSIAAKTVFMTTLFSIITIPFVVMVFLT